MASFLTVEVRFLAHSSWRPVVLYDGDSLTFPLLWAALAHGEPLHPVMSTQLLFFPEGVIYALARVATTSIRASLVAVAYLNIILFYLGLRALAAVVVDGPAARRRLAAVVPTLLLIAEMLLERVMGVNHTTIATPFLFDSWYAGVILVGIGALAFAAYQIRGAATLSWRRQLTAAVLATGVLTATTISDPLFLVQIILPFLLVAAVLGILGRLRGPLLGWVAGPHLGAIALSLALTPLYGPLPGRERLDVRAPPRRRSHRQGPGGRPPPGPAQRGRARRAGPHGRRLDDRSGDPGGAGAASPARHRRIEAAAPRPSSSQLWPSWRRPP